MPKLTPEQAINRNLDSCNRNVVAHRQAVATALELGSGAYRLSTVINQLAAAEGQRDLWFRLKNEYVFGGENFGRAEAFQFVLQVLSRGAEDSWAGRNNDVKRASFDGLRHAARAVDQLFL
jgi:hypothetical protein